MVDKDLRRARGSLNKKISRYEDKGFVVDMEAIAEIISAVETGNTIELINALDDIRENLGSFSQYIMNHDKSDAEKELVSYEEGVAERKRQQAEARKQKKDFEKAKAEGRPTIGHLAYANVYYDFISKLREEVPPPPVRKSRSNSIRWRAYLALQRQQRYLLQLIHSEVEEYGEDEIGLRLYNASPEVQEKLNTMLYAASTEEVVNECSTEIARVIANRTLSMEENTILTEQAEEAQEIY